MPQIEMIGRRFGNLVVIGETKSHRVPSGAIHRKFLCQCDCGNKKAIIGYTLRKGISKSCGCAHLKRISKHNHTKSHYQSPTYRSWSKMKDRCYNPNNKRYKDYGGRGIKTCDSWLTFKNFLADMGERPKGKTLDRCPNNNGNYEPGNCRWATPREQMQNQRPKKCTTIEYCNQRYTIKQFSDKFNISLRSVYYFYKQRNLSPEHILKFHRGDKICD